MPGATESFRSGPEFQTSAYIGKDASGRGAGKTPSRLLNRGEMIDLVSVGFEFGSHAQHHLDLTTLAPTPLRAELLDSRRRLERELGAPARFFAAPYGCINAAVREEISRSYDLAVGARLATTARRSDFFDLPRVEMQNFRNAGIWRSFSKGAPTRANWPAQSAWQLRRLDIIFQKRSPRPWVRDRRGGGR